MTTSSGAPRSVCLRAHARYSSARRAEAWSGRPALGAVSYGTEAGLFQAAGIPSIICGPGRIAEAHRPDESIGHADLEECCAMLRRVIAHQSRAETNRIASRALSGPGSDEFGIQQESSMRSILAGFAAGLLVAGAASAQTAAPSTAPGAPMGTGPATTGTVAPVM